MKRTIITILLPLALLGSACDRKSTVEEKHEHVEASASVYYCPMHPTVTSDKPGSCPICGMRLVKRDAAATTIANSGSVSPAVAEVTLSPEERVTANVKTLRIEAQTETGDIVTTGRVTFDERRIAQVSAYTGGRIERLFANFTGDSVRRGDVVATIYSPELLTAQREHLVALKYRGTTNLSASSRRRLQLLGMTNAQISQLERRGAPIAATSVVAPVSGVVTQKLVTPQQYVAAGQTLLEVADLSTVWVEADVYEQQLPNVHVGQRVTITSPALGNQESPATVSFIQPVIAGESRTARVRVEMVNPRMQLKPDMYVSVRIFGGTAAPHIMIPASAVVDRGHDQYVWVERSSGSFEPRRVTTAGRHGEFIVIAAGLSAGETIASEGGFLLDSEAQLRGATAASSAQQGAPPSPHAGHQGH